MNGLGLHHSHDPRVVELPLFAVTFHDPDDEQGERAAGWLTSPAAGLRVLQILKDADALDRGPLRAAQPGDPIPTAGRV